ncbi:MAG: 23S rRNA (guanosine(2251)-2'-O)-methyltransferase RlmB [Kiritimatiellae bacterium]|nr:23S rRNA (guanosine(2251)-2'-O)-methyltransferase RlmB [Kiritimatiellia bacterium]
MADFRKPWERSEFRSSSDRPSRPGFKKPWEKRGGDDRPPRPGFKKPWEKRGEDGAEERRPFRKPWESRGEGAEGGEERRPFRPARRSEGFGGTFRRKPWESRGEGADRPPRSGFRKPWESRGEEGGEDRPPRSGFRKPWEDRAEGGEDRPPRPRFERKPWEDRGPRGEGRTGFAPHRKPRAAAIPAEGELVYGRQPVREILRAGRRAVNLVVLSDGVKDSEEVLEIKNLCAERGVKIEFYKREDLEAWVNGANHQGVVAFCAEFPYCEVDEIADALAAAPGNACVVVLDHVQDPQNLGSILRTCECAGVLGVVLPVDRAVAVTPAAVRASAGAAEHLKIARISNLVSALERFKGAGAWITGLEAVPGAKPYVKVDYKGKACLVIGSEAHGICSPVRRKCDFLSRLPMLGKVNSLNAGVAAAVALYEMLRQQGANDLESNFPAVELPPEPETAEPDPAALEEAPAEDSAAEDPAEGLAAGAPASAPDSAPTEDA